MSEFLRISLILLFTYVAASQSMTWLLAGYWMAWKGLLMVAVPVSLLQSAVFCMWWRSGE